jgi:hypothetical protein
MHIVTKRHLEEAMEAYKDAANEIEAWQAIVKMGRSLRSQSSTTLVFFRIVPEEIGLGRQRPQMRVSMIAMPACRKVWRNSSSSCVSKPPPSTPGRSPPARHA